jgi:MYXO-CTERM domain-containing protein
MNRTTTNTATAPLTVIASLVLLLALPSAAEAFQLKTTYEGEYIRWDRTDVEVVLDESLADLGPRDAVEATVIAAFDEWVDSADLPLEFHFVIGSCGEPGHRPGDHNENCVMARTGYFDDDTDAGATSLASHDAASGVIKDADIVINAASGLWAVDDQDGTYDLHAAVLHEVGHFLGLAHSEIAEARMRPTLSDEEASAGLHADDIAGATALYEGLTSSDGLRCSVATVGNSAPRGWMLIALLGALAIARRRN